MSNGSNFFSNIFSIFIGGNNPDAIKRKQLKTIAKNYGKSKNHFYKPGTNTAEVPMAKFFYEMYKVMSPVQLMFQNISPNALKRLVVNGILTDEQHEMVDSFSEESIIARSRSNTDLKSLSKEIAAELKAFNAEFNSAKIKEIDALYSKIVMMSNFSKYDFFFILKKFDNSLRERDFNTLPHFRGINADYVPEDLKNFLAIAWSLPFDDDWTDVIQLLRRYKGVEPVTVQVWKKLLNQMKSLRDKNVFEMIIQLITQDPLWDNVVKVEHHQIMDEYLSSIRKQVEETLEKIQKQQKEGKIDGLLTQVFGTSDIDPLKYYNEENSSAYERKHLDGYVYAAPLCYLKHFLLDFGKRDIRELSDILLVRGEWATTQLSTPMSEAYHQLMEISDQILRLDERMSESSDSGAKIKTLLPRVERDREARNIANMVIGDANEEAANLIARAVQNLINYDRNLKMAIEDFVRMPRSELIINWKDLDHFAEGKLKAMCVDTYKKIYQFVQLLNNFQVSAYDGE